MTHLNSVLKRLLQGLQLAESGIAAVVLVITTLLIFAQVLNRYWLHFRIMWLGDVALYCFIFFMLVAATVATWKEGHVTVDAFRDRIYRGKPRGMAIHRAALTIVTIILLCIFLPLAFDFMLSAIKYPEYGTLARWFNMSWLQITLFIALAFVLLHLLVIAHRDTNNAIGIYRSQPGGKKP